MLTLHGLIFNQVGRATKSRASEGQGGESHGMNDGTHGFSWWYSEKTDQTTDNYFFEPN